MYTNETEAKEAGTAVLAEEVWYIYCISSFKALILLHTNLVQAAYQLHKNNIHDISICYKEALLYKVVSGCSVFLRGPKIHRVFISVGVQYMHATKKIEHPVFSYLYILMHFSFPDIGGVFVLRHHGENNVPTEGNHDVSVSVVENDYFSLVCGGSKLDYKTVNLTHTSQGECCRLRKS